MVQNEIQSSTLTLHAMPRLHVRLSTALYIPFSDFLDVMNWLFCFVIKALLPRSIVDLPYDRLSFSDVCTHCTDNASVIAGQEFASIVEAVKQAKCCDIAKHEETIVELAQEKHSFDLCAYKRILNDLREVVEKSQSEPETEQETGVFDQRE